jgi:hypothetical protein
MTDQADQARTAAYADLVSALAGARHDPASDRFDRELAAAEAAGTVDPATARTLRWWQRESVRAVEDHLSSVLPHVLTSLDSAGRDAVATVAASAESWAAASGAPAAEPPPYGDGPDHPGGGVRGTSTPPPGSTPGGARPAADPSAPYLRPVDTASTDRAGAAAPLKPGFVPPPTTPPGSPDAHESVTGGAPPRRLLVAGLTVLTDDDHTPPTRSRTAHGDAPGATG